MCGDLSTLRNWRCEFSIGSVFSSPILGSVSPIKTFICGHLCMVTFLHLETGDVNFPLIQFSKLSIGSVFPLPILGSVSMFKTFMCGHLCVVTFLYLQTRDVNFLLIQFSELSIGSVFPVTHPRFCLNI